MHYKHKFFLLITHPDPDWPVGIFFSLPEKVDSKILIERDQVIYFSEEGYSSEAFFVYKKSVFTNIQAQNSYIEIYAQKIFDETEYATILQLYPPNNERMVHSFLKKEFEKFNNKYKDVVLLQYFEGMNPIGEFEEIYNRIPIKTNAYAEYVKDSNYMPIYR